jgi:hypothetical protein
MAGPNFAGLGQFRLHYTDGSTEEVRLTSKAVVEAERRWPGVAPDGSDRYRPNEGLHYMVWITLGRPEDDFDTWLDLGFVMEPVEEEPEVDPTHRAPGADSSLSSPPARASRRNSSKTPRQRVS